MKPLMASELSFCVGISMILIWCATASVVPGPCTDKSEATLCTTARENSTFYRVECNRLYSNGSVVQLMAPRLVLYNSALTKALVNAADKRVAKARFICYATYSAYICGDVEAGTWIDLPINHSATNDWDIHLASDWDTGAPIVTYCGYNYTASAESYVTVYNLSSRQVIRQFLPNGSTRGSRINCARAPNLGSLFTVYSVDGKGTTFDSGIDVYSQNTLTGDPMGVRTYGACVGAFATIYTDSPMGDYVAIVCNNRSGNFLGIADLTPGNVSNRVVAWNLLTSYGSVLSPPGLFDYSPFMSQYMNLPTVSRSFYTFLSSTASAQFATVDYTGAFTGIGSLITLTRWAYCAMAMDYSGIYGFPFHCSMYLSTNSTSNGPILACPETGVYYYIPNVTSGSLTFRMQISFNGRYVCAGLDYITNPHVICGSTAPGSNVLLNATFPITHVAGMVATPFDNHFCMLAGDGVSLVIGCFYVNDTDIYNFTVIAVVGNDVSQGWYEYIDVLESPACIPATPPPIAAVTPTRPPAPAPVPAPASAPVTSSVSPPTAVPTPFQNPMPSPDVPSSVDTPSIVTSPAAACDLPPELIGWYCQNGIAVFNVLVVINNGPLNLSASNINLTNDLVVNSSSVLSLSNLNASAANVIITSAGLVIESSNIFISGNFESNSSTVQVNGESTVHLGGNLFLSEASSITFNTDNPQPPIDVAGCVKIEGNIIVEVNSSKLEQDGNVSFPILSSASDCVDVSFAQVVVHGVKVDLCHQSSLLYANNRLVVYVSITDRFQCVSTAHVLTGFRDFSFLLLLIFLFFN